MSASTAGPKPWSSAVTSSISASSNGHRPRRHPAAPIAATATTFTTAPDHSSDRGSPPVSRYRGADTQ